ncbi:MAG: type II toxin-antitoxin system VapC family toxin [Candidatus Sulfotelmatobacter sp.]
MRVLLDTAVFIFSAQSPDRLTSRAASVLKNPENIRELSAISLTEIAVKFSLGKLTMSSALVRQAIEDLDIRLLSFTADHAFELFNLAGAHRDPFDRQIIAQALWEEIPVVSPDPQFSRYAGLKVIW